LVDGESWLSVNTQIAMLFIPIKEIILNLEISAAPVSRPPFL